MSAPERIVSVPLDRIDLDDVRFQIRVEAGAGELRRSLERDGQIVPVLLQAAGERWRVIDGHRRCAVLRRIGARTVRAVVRRVADAEALRLAFVANHARKTLKPADRWNAIRKMKAAGWSNETIAEATSLHRETVRKLAALFPAMREVDEGLATGWLRQSHLIALRSLVPRAEWSRWLRLIRDERLSAARLYDRVGAQSRLREPPYVTKERPGVLVFRGFRFDAKAAAKDEIWRAITQYEDGLDALRAWVRRQS